MLGMLTGSELEQAERLCCSNVLLSFNCAQCNFCVPHGHLATLTSRAVICQWLLSEEKYVGGILSGLMATATSAKMEEKRMILMSPEGDQP